VAWRQITTGFASSGTTPHPASTTSGTTNTATLDGPGAPAGQA
jgi:hypothetical protein